MSLDGMKEMFHSAGGHKKLWLTNGRRHFDSYFYNPEKYTERVRTFINQVLSGKFKKSCPHHEVIEDDDCICSCCAKKGQS